MLQNFKTPSQNPTRNMNKSGLCNILKCYFCDIQTEIQCLYSVRFPWVFLPSSFLSFPSQFPIRFFFLPLPFFLLSSFLSLFFSFLLKPSLTRSSYPLFPSTLSFLYFPPHPFPYSPSLPALPFRTFPSTSFLYFSFSFALPISASFNLQSLRISGSDLLNNTVNETTVSPKEEEEEEEETGISTDLVFLRILSTLSLFFVMLLCFPCVWFPLFLRLVSIYTVETLYIFCVFLHPTTWSPLREVLGYFKKYKSN